MSTLGSRLIVTLCMSAAIQAMSHAATPAEQAFIDGQAIAHGTTQNAATGVTNGTLANTVNSFNPSYYNSSGTAPESALFLGGNGDTLTAGSAKITSCQTGAANPDKFLQQNCDAISYMAKNPSTRLQFTISPTDPNIAASRTIEKNASTLAAKSLGFVDPNAVGSFTGCASKTTTTPPTFGIEVCYDAATATSQMCTIGRTVVVNANTSYQCNKTANTYQTQTCNRTLNVVVTQPAIIAATPIYSCGAGYTLSGTNCTAPATAAYQNYSCTSGTLSGTQCNQPPYQPPGSSATSSTSLPHSPYAGWDGFCRSCNPWSACPNIYGYLLAYCIPGSTTYSCPAGYTLSGTTCYPPKVTPPPIPATLNYSCAVGSTLSGNTCVPQNIPANVTYSCGYGMTLSGTTCIPNSVITTSWNNGCATQQAAAL